MKSKQQLYDDEDVIRAKLNRLKDHLEFINAIKITNENREQLEKDRQAIFEKMKKLQAELSDIVDCIGYYNTLEKHKGEL
jgi:hypothetical protein